MRSTFGVHAKKRKHAWIRPDKNFKSQIDYILVNNRYKNCLTKCRPITKPDCGTDHNYGGCKYKNTIEQKLEGEGKEEN